MGALAVHGNSAVSTERRSRPAKRIPAVKDVYAPGALRAVTDAEHGRVAVFCEKHPELARLGYEGLRQVAATYRDEAGIAESGELRAAGVPSSWRREDGDDVNPRWSDDS